MGYSEYYFARESPYRGTTIVNEQLFLTVFDASTKPISSRL